MKQSWVRASTLLQTLCHSKLALTGLQCHFEEWYLLLALLMKQSWVGASFLSQVPCHCKHSFRQAALQLALTGLQRQFEGVASDPYIADEAVMGASYLSRALARFLGLFLWQAAMP